MEEFEKSINEFLSFRKYDILIDNGTVSHKQAKQKAEIFNRTQKIESDFDKEVKKMVKKR